MHEFLNQIATEATLATAQLCDAASLKKGDLFVIGCSSSEVLGEKIGTGSSPQVGETLVSAIKTELDRRGIYLAAQCCEHLNRAIIIERAALPFAEEVNVVPVPKAGGSFATAAYAAMSDPIAVESVRAHAGIDIGGTLIGMHLRAVAVPVRLSVRAIGAAPILCARTRARFIGGERANYDKTKQ